MKAPVPSPDKRETAAEVAAYRAAMDTATLRTLRLISSQFEMKPEALSLSRDNWSQGFNCGTSEVSYNRERNTITCLIDAEAFCKQGRRKILSVRCRYIVSYNVAGEPEPAAAERFASHVGRFAAYPYFRAHFAELTAQAGLSLPPLPVMKEGKRVIEKVKPDALQEG